jgi:hypothetical protein
MDNPARLVERVNFGSAHAAAVDLRDVQDDHGACFVIIHDSLQREVERADSAQGRHPIRRKLFPGMKVRPPAKRQGSRAAECGILSEVAQHGLGVFAIEVFDPLFREPYRF